MAWVAVATAGAAVLTYMSNNAATQAQSATAAAQMALSNEQLNAQLETDISKVNAQLKADIDKFNASQTNTINTNQALIDERIAKFNADAKNRIAALNAAAKNRAAEINAVTAGKKDVATSTTALAAAQRKYSDDSIKALELRAKGDFEAAAKLLKDSSASVATAEADLQSRVARQKKAREDIAKGQFQSWENTFGSIQSNLAGFYSAMTPESLAATGLTKQAETYKQLSAEIETRAAQQGIDTPAKDFMQLSLAVSNAKINADIRHTAAADVRKEQQQFIAQGKINPATGLMYDAAAEDTTLYTGQAKMLETQSRLASHQGDIASAAITQQEQTRAAATSTETSTLAALGVTKDTTATVSASEATASEATAPDVTAHTDIAAPVAAATTVAAPPPSAPIEENTDRTPIGRGNGDTYAEKKAKKAAAKAKKDKPERSTNDSYDPTSRGNRDGL